MRESAAPVAGGRPRDPAAALPSDTSVRYLLLVATVFTTTCVIYMRFWLDRLDPRSPYEVCVPLLTRAGIGAAVVTPTDAQSVQMTALIRCAAPDAATALRYALAGVLAVLVVALAAYLAAPRWR